MNDIDYQALLSAYQKKVSELSNQVVVYEAKINSLTAMIGELNLELEKTKKIKRNTKQEEDF